ncbi:MAG: MOSC domain-containing protein [Actinomycetaceae bacterium]|nr:MOSC domain-containing protein [Actinomycetaceae bacterium]
MTGETREALRQGATLTLEAVCAAAEIHADAGKFGVTAIDKRSVAGPVAVHRFGLRGDFQVDRKDHGGQDRALYAYSRDEADYWSGVLGREVTPGLFGENLRVGGPVDSLELGARLRVGDVELVATGQRTPCMTFARWLGREGFVKEFSARGCPGVYLGVVRVGTIEAGQTIEVVDTPGHGITVGDWSVDPSPARARALLDSQARGRFEIATYMRARVEAAARRGADA